MSEKLTGQKILGLLKANEAHIKGFGVRSLGLFGSFAKRYTTDLSREAFENDDKTLPKRAH